ncbi:DUF397 domain-containing protein [Actinomadura geliboluensis]|uniref:DUF397 domain-containing protein n=1 Tax=Actinomadura geliboluensis TaxID=882440 RepID=UPI0036A0EE4A
MDLEIAVWKKAARSNDSGDACVEVGANSEIVAIRDSKDPDGPKIILTHDELRRFTDTLKRS